MAYTPLNREDLRIFLRDFAQNNILLDDVQFTTDELTRAIQFAVDEFQSIPPIIGGTEEDMPRHMLLLGAASWLMLSESFLQIRNQASYQDGDVQGIGIDDKHQLYLNMSSNLRAQWKQAAQDYKRQLNLESVYGSISSGYRNVGRFHNN